MTDKTEAMDKLIAQDADLIDLQPMLSPCPFCGGVQIEAFHHIDRGWGASWHIECVADECGNSTCHHDTEANAIAAWNRRQYGYEAGVEASANALEDDAKLCDCFARNEGECGCGAWDDDKSITSARAVEIVRALQEQSK